jgi:spore coat-associated protein N
MNNSTIPPWTLKLADRAAKTLMIGAAVIGGGALVGSGVFAALNATAFNPAGQLATTQTLKLTQTASSVTGITGGITTAISNLAPGDVVHRFIDLTNGGTMGGTNLKLQLADSTSSLLTSDAAKGLQIAITECSTAWTALGACGGTPTTVMASTAASSLIATAKTVSVGSLASSAVNRLKIEITLPNSTETTTNGVLPANTIQGLSSSLTWTFTEDQRLATISQQ